MSDLSQMKAQVEALAAAELEAVLSETEPTGAITSRLIRQCLYSNERGDGLLFARMYRDKFVFVKRTGMWMVWNGVHWEMDTKQLAQNAVEAVADAYNNERLAVEELAKTEYSNGNKDEAERLISEKKAYIRRIERLRSVRGVANCLEFAHKIGVESLAVIGDEIDCKPWLLPCKNGVIDMRTGFLQSGRPSDYLMTAIPTTFPKECGYYLNTGENSLCPTWDRVILEIHNSDPELAHFIQKWIGYNFTGCTTEHYIGVFVGAGRNGKGTLFETLKSVMGSLAWAIQPDMLLEQKNARSSAGPSADMMSLYGKRLVMASETDEGKRISGSRVKSLTGADSINARSPHDKFEINFTPSHKLNLYTNHIRRKHNGADMKDLYGNDDIEAMYQAALRVPLVEKIEMAIQLIQTFEKQALALSDSGYYVCFSGGKDSIVMAKLFEMAGVKYNLNYSNVTIDPPELVQFIKREYPQTVWHSQGKPLPLAMADNANGPPTMFIRWCCSKYKEQGGRNALRSIGVRADESKRRKGLWRTVAVDSRSKNPILCPILYWTDADVWQFIRDNSMPYCSLYDDGFKRLGCIG